MGSGGGERLGIRGENMDGVGRGAKIWDGSYIVIKIFIAYKILIN